MLYYRLNTYFLSVYLILFYPITLLSQIVRQSNLQRGVERIYRNNDWAWGTGYGGFDDAVRLFGAENEIETYTIGDIVYRVFSRGNKNYVEMNTRFGERYTYTTQSDEVIRPIEFSKGNEPIIGNSNLLSKTIRKDDHWKWGVNYSSFDQAAYILGQTANIITFIDPNDEKVKYRLFTYRDINYVEVDYGWQNGIFTYITYDL
jgi:hypothetical protein